MHGSQGCGTDSSAEGLGGASRSSAVVGWALRIALLGVCLVCLAYWGQLTWQRLCFPYEIDYTEAGLLAKASLWAAGVSPYAPTTHLPYVPLVYPPLFVALWAPFTRLAGLTFWPGRLIACLGLLLILACLVRIVRHFGGGWSTCLLAVTCFVSLPPVRAWSGLARVDTLAIGLSALGLCVFIVGQPRARGWGTLCFILAVLTKHVVVAAPLAAYLALFWNGERRAAGQQALLFGAGVCGAFAALQVATGGGFVRDVITGNLNPWFPQLVRDHLQEFLRAAPLLPAAALGALALALGRPQTRVLALCLVFGLASSLACGKVGSGPNYLLELGVGLVLVVMGVCRPQLRWSTPLSLRNELVLALVFIQLLLVVHPSTFPNPNENRAHQAQLLELVKAVPGEVLGEPMGPIVLAGKRLWTEPFVIAQMAQAGHWDERPLLDLVQQHRFGAILIEPDPALTANSVAGAHTERWSPALLQVIDHEYQITDRVDGVMLLRPRGPTVAGERLPPQR